MDLKCKYCGTTFNYDEECREYKEQADLINKFLDDDQIPVDLNQTWYDGCLCASCAVDASINRKICFEKQKIKNIITI